MTDSPDLTIASLDDLDLDLAGKVASGRYGVRLAPALIERIAAGRDRYERFMQRKGGYVYGSTTAPGSRAKTLLAPEDSARQGSSLGAFINSGPGFTGRMAPARTVRLALLTRLTNSLTGQGKLTAPTVEAICRLIGPDAPAVPLDGQAGPGEVMACRWLLDPISDRPLKMGEAMALANGSPFAGAMVTDVALTTRRQLQLAFKVFALSAEAARMPRGHFDPRLGAGWPDPFYRQALAELDGLLDGGAAERLSHQAPVAWRATPNMMAEGLRASDGAAGAALLAMRSLKDNPTFLLGDTEDDDVIFSSAGYQDQRSGRAIDVVNAAWSDLAFVAYRQVAKLVGGVDLGLPLMLSRTPADGIGAEYIVWTLTTALAKARQAAAPAGLDLSLEDPGGGQSDLAQPAFVAYARHLDAAGALTECLAALYTASKLALVIRGAPLPAALRAFCDEVPWAQEAGAANAAAAGAPMRAVADYFSAQVWPEDKSGR